jgi:diguanylate cyclase (GGDEF)-like protein
VLLAAVEGQHHVLGLRMVADVLEGAGFDVLYLGADVPTASLAEMIREYRPTATGLSCTFPGRSQVLIDAIIAIADSGAETRIFLGGRGVPPVLRDTGYPWQNTSIGIVKMVDELLAEPVQPLPPAIKALRSTSGAADSVEADADYDSPADTRMLGIVEDANEQSRRHARRAQDFRYLAFHDPVTGMPNRRAFDDRVAESNSKALEGALMMIDLDRFKDVNDGHGHDAGDELLRVIGHAIEAGRRPGDFAARTGGDEFAVLLPEASLDAAVEVAERIRDNVKRANDYNVTASVGLAPLTGNPRADLLAADEALYTAKEAGRDRSAATTRGAPSPG